MPAKRKFEAFGSAVRIVACDRTVPRKPRTDGRVHYASSDACGRGRRSGPRGDAALGCAAARSERRQSSQLVAAPGAGSSRRRPRRSCRRSPSSRRAAGLVARSRGSRAAGPRGETARASHHSFRRGAATKSRRGQPSPHGLGRSRHRGPARDALRLVVPHYDASRHDPLIGVNLVQEATRSAISTWQSAFSKASSGSTDGM